MKRKQIIILSSVFFLFFVAQNVQARVQYDSATRTYSQSNTIRARHARTYSQTRKIEAAAAGKIDYTNTNNTEQKNTADIKKDTKTAAGTVVKNANQEVDSTKKQDSTSEKKVRKSNYIQSRTKE